MAADPVEVRQRRIKHVGRDALLLVAGLTPHIGQIALLIQVDRPINRQILLGESFSVAGPPRKRARSAKTT
jgi:hypothetical protein